MARRPLLPAALRKKLTAHGARPSTVRVEDVELMLASPRTLPFSAEGWLFEIKYDGFRVLAARQGGRARLLYRAGGDATSAFPEVAEAIQALSADDDFVLDGELVACGEDGRPRFQALQQRYRRARGRGSAGPVEAACRFYAFDLLAVGGLDLRPVPLVERKEALASLVADVGVGAVRRVEPVETAGEALFAEVRRLGLEGMVGKRKESRYAAGRSRDWLKVRLDRQGEFLIVGFTRPGLGEQGGLHLAAAEEGGLTYAGRVGTGFDPGVLDEVRALLAQFKETSPPCVGSLPRGREHTWVQARIRCEVRYKERTEEGLLRHPVFLRFVAGG